MNKPALVIACSLLAVACSKQPDQDKSNVLLDSQRAALDKARQTEQMVMDAAEKQRKELEKNEQ